MQTNKSVKLNILNRNEMASIHGGESGGGLFCSCPCCCCCDSNTNKSVQKAIDKADNCRCNAKSEETPKPQPES